MRFRELTKTLSPCAHMFFLVVWNRWRLVGSVETCPTQRRRVPITNILTTTPIRVYSINHRLQNNKSSINRASVCYYSNHSLYFYTIIFSSLCHFLPICVFSPVYIVCMPFLCMEEPRNLYLLIYLKLFFKTVIIIGVRQHLLYLD